MTARHLIADGDLTLLCDIASYQLVNSWRKLIAVLTGEYLDIDNNARFAVGDLQGVVSYFLGLFTENSSQKSFFSGKLGLSLRSYLSDEDIAGSYLCTDTNDTTVIEVLKSVLTNVGDISCDGLGTELCISFLDLILFNMDRGVNIFTDNTLVKKNGVLVVVAFPGHEADKSILTDSKLAVAGCGTVRKDLTNVNFLALVNDRSLVYAGTLVGALELGELIGMSCACAFLDNDLVSGNTLNNTVMLGNDAHA